MIKTMLPVWGWDGRGWVRTYVDGNAIAAQPGCYANQPSGTCNSYVLGSDRNLWLEPDETGGHGSTSVDSNVSSFFGSAMKLATLPSTKSRC